MINPAISVYNDFKKKYGIDITFNGKTYKAVIKDTNDSLVKSMKIDQGIINFGDYLTIYNKIEKITETYIVIEKSTPKYIYDEIQIQLCNNTLRYRATIDGVLGVAEIPCIIKKGETSLNIDDGVYITVLANEMTCIVGYSMFYIAQNINELNGGTRLIITHRAWSVKACDGVSDAIYNTKGLITIRVNSTSNLIADDLINDIPAPSKVVPVVILPHTYTIALTSSSKTLENTTAYKIEIGECTKDDLIVVSPLITYTVNNSDICTVSSTGLITGVSIGTATITVAYGNASAILDVTIIAKV